jgi:hypothetical protein
MSCDQFHNFDQFYNFDQFHNRDVKKVHWGWLICDHACNYDHTLIQDQIQLAGRVTPSLLYSMRV